MVVPLPTSASLPSRTGATPATVVKLRPKVLVCAGLLAAMALWTLVLTIKMPQDSEIHGGVKWIFSYTFLAGSFVYAASEMDLQWITWLGMMSASLAVCDLIFFLDFWVKGHIAPFGDAYARVQALVCYVPIFIFAFSTYLAYRVYEEYILPHAIESSWQRDQDGRAGNRQQRAPAMEPFMGTGNRLGSTDV